MTLHLLAAAVALAWLVTWLLGARLLRQARRALAPGAPRRRQVEGAERLAHALDLLRRDLLGGCPADTAALLDHGQGQVDRARAFLAGWGWWSYLRPLHTLRQLKASGLHDRTPFGQALVEAVEGIDKGSIRQAADLDPLSLDDSGRALAELERRLGLVAPLVEATAGAWAAMRDDPALGPLVPARGPADRLERGRGALARAGRDAGRHGPHGPLALREGLEACAEAAWLAAVASCWQLAPAARGAELALAQQTGERAACVRAPGAVRWREQGDERMGLMAWWAAHEAYAQALAAHERSRATRGEGGALSGYDGGRLSGHGGRSSGHDGGGGSSYPGGGPSGSAPPKVGGRRATG